MYNKNLELNIILVAVEKKTDTKNHQSFIKESNMLICNDTITKNKST